MACPTQSLLATMPTLVQILKEHHEINPTEMERLTKMLKDKDIKLVEQAKEASCWSQREADLQASLQKANDLLLWWDRELEVKH